MQPVGEHFSHLRFNFIAVCAGNRFCVCRSVYTSAVKWFSGSRLWLWWSSYRTLYNTPSVNTLCTYERTRVIHFSSSSGWHLICIFMAQLHYEGRVRTRAHEQKTWDKREEISQRTHKLLCVQKAKLYRECGTRKHTHTHPGKLATIMQRAHSR